MKFKKYKSHRLKIQIEYPTEWQVEEEEELQSVTFAMPPEQNPFLSISFEDISHLPDISFEELNEISSKAIMDDLENYDIDGFEFLDKLIPLKLAGFDFVKNVFTLESDGLKLKQMQLYTLISHKYFVFTYTSNIDSYEENWKTVKKMINTFQYMKNTIEEQLIEKYSDRIINELLKLIQKPKSMEILKLEIRKAIESIEKYLEENNLEFDEDGKELFDAKESFNTAYEEINELIIDTEKIKDVMKKSPLLKTTNYKNFRKELKASLEQQTQFFPEIAEDLIEFLEEYAKSMKEFYEIQEKIFKKRLKIAKVDGIDNAISKKTNKKIIKEIFPSANDYKSYVINKINCNQQFSQELNEKINERMTEMIRRSSGLFSNIENPIKEDDLSIEVELENLMSDIGDLMNSDFGIALRFIRSNISLVFGNFLGEILKESLNLEIKEIYD